LAINARLTAVAAARDQPLLTALAAVGGSGGQAPDVVAVAVSDLETADLDRYLGGPAGLAAAACGITGRAGEVVQLPIALPAGTAAETQPAPGGLHAGGGRWGRLMLVGLGGESAAEMRAAGAALGRRLTSPARVLTSVAHGRCEPAVSAFAEGLLLGGYRFSLREADMAGEAAPLEVSLLTREPDACQTVLDRATAVTRAVSLARDLANTPSDRKSPAWLADQAVAVAVANGLAARVWDERDLASEGFGGLLGVGAGSVRPPRLIMLSYHPPHPARHIVLVGKGITFDSGGLSLKPNDNMKMMKTDMAGGAVVIAVASALAALAAPVRVTGLIAAAENMPSGSALRPGDVITHYGGQTVEVLNTDAEGRLVLADALWYARSVLRPDIIVDIATLTGAARVALGSRTGALYANDDALAAALLTAAADSGEALWRMPLVDEYREGLDSPVADLANVARGTGTRAGSIDAAMFLREFAGECPWAHLDVAGAARADADDGEIAKGATGFGTRLLLRWLCPTPA
jgi:leucyl aminopeptidase